jgi:hypothetical protein
MPKYNSLFNANIAIHFFFKVVFETGHKRKELDVLTQVAGEHEHIEFGRCVPTFTLGSLIHYCVVVGLRKRHFLRCTDSGHYSSLIYEIK